MWTLLTVDVQMLRQIIFQFESFATDTTDFKTTYMVIDCMLLQMCIRNDYISTFVTLVALAQLVSTVHFKVLTQQVWIRAGKVTSIAFVSVCVFKCFFKLPAWEEAYDIVTLVAFVWLFSTVCFQMFLQIACLRRALVTLVAFVWVPSNVGHIDCMCLTFSTVHFQMFPEKDCFLKSPAWDEASSQMCPKSPLVRQTGWEMTFDGWN